MIVNNSRILENINLKGVHHLNYADVSWQQVEAQPNVWNFDKSDSAINNIQQIITIPTLYGISAGSNTVGLQVPWQASSKSFFDWHFCDTTVTMGYVRTIIIQYKTSALLWEISNEMALIL